MTSQSQPIVANGQTEAEPAAADALEQAVVLLMHLNKGWWASYRLAIEIGTTRPPVSRVLQRLKRRGVVESGGQHWRLKIAEVAR